MSLAGLSLRDLEYLVAVADHRHFGRAATACAVSQPALSTQIRKLEAWLGITIFERTASGVLVTADGTAVLTHARAVLAEAGALVAAARASRAGAAGPFRLSAIPTLGPYLLPHVLRPLRHTFPDLRLILSENRTAEQYAALLAGELDAGLSCLPVPNRAIVAHQLFFEPFVLAHPPGRAPDWPELTIESDLLLLEEGHCLRDQAVTFCAQALPRARRHATGLEILRHMVAAGEGCTLMPALAVPGASAGLDGLVAYTPIPDPMVGREIGLLVRRSDPRAALMAQIAAVLRCAAPPPARALEPALHAA